MYGSVMVELRPRFITTKSRSRVRSFCGNETTARLRCPCAGSMTVSRSLGSDNTMRQIAVLLLATCGVIATMTIGGCSLGDSEGYKLNTRIRQAHEELIANGANDMWFTQAMRLDRPFVVVLLPAERISGESI